MIIEHIHPRLIQVFQSRRRTVMPIKKSLLYIFLIFLLTPLCASAQDDNSMEKLQRDLRWYTELVNDEDAWCVTTDIFFREPGVLHRKDVINRLIFFLNGPGKYSGYTLADALKIVSKQSQTIKENIRQTTIPDIENRIRVHRAANATTPFKKEYCGGLVTVSYLTTIKDNLLRPKIERWKKLRWKRHAWYQAHALVDFTKQNQNEANLRLWEKRVNCVGGCYEQQFQSEKANADCVLHCNLNTEYINCDHMK